MHHLNEILQNKKKAYNENEVMTFLILKRTNVWADLQLDLLALELQTAAKTAFLPAVLFVKILIAQTYICDTWAGDALNGPTLAPYSTRYFSLFVFPSEE